MQMRARVALLLLVLVDAHVAIEIARLRESELTQLTLVRFLPTVHSHVLGKGRRVREGFPTVFAPINNPNGGALERDPGNW